MDKPVTVIGAGLAGSEAALVLARSGCPVRLYEMRPERQTPVHKTGLAAELVCSNSLKSKNPASAAGMLKAELAMLDSPLLALALECTVDAGGALALERNEFAQAVTRALESNPFIALERAEVTTLAPLVQESSAIILATGPLTADGLADDLAALFGREALAFYDAAAPIVLTESLDRERLYAQNRYGRGEGADYLNAFLDRAAYESFVTALVEAERVIRRDFESRELFSACQPIEEVARSGLDALRFGALKPVGLTDPLTGRRPWAAVQLRREDRFGQSYNLVGFQTNLTFGEQQRVFRMVPGLEHAEFARFGVMHRNTFIDAPRLLAPSLRWRDPSSKLSVPLYVTGQLSGTEGYVEAIRSGHHGALSAIAALRDLDLPSLPTQTAFGALLSAATDPACARYQPMHVNFGVMEPLSPPVRSKRLRAEAYAKRGQAAMESYVGALEVAGLLRPDQRAKGRSIAEPFLPAKEGDDGGAAA